MKMRIVGWFNGVYDHMASNLTELQWEQGMEPPNWWQIVREWTRAFAQHIWYDLMAAYCKRFGHNAEVEEFVDAEYEEFPDDGLEHKPRIVDINGGGVDWFCKRCGMGGRSRF